MLNQPLFFIAAVHLSWATNIEKYDSLTGVACCERWEVAREEGNSKVFLPPPSILPICTTPATASFFQEEGTQDTSLHSSVLCIDGSHPLRFAHHLDSCLLLVMMGTVLVPCSFALLHHCNHLMMTMWIFMQEEPQNISSHSPPLSPPHRIPCPPLVCPPLQPAITCCNGRCPSPVLHCLLSTLPLSNDDNAI